MTNENAIENIAFWLERNTDLSETERYDEANRFVNSENYDFGETIEYKSKYTNWKPVILG